MTTPTLRRGSCGLYARRAAILVGGCDTDDAPWRATSALGIGAATGGETVSPLRLPRTSDRVPARSWAWGGRSVTPPAADQWAPRLATRGRNHCPIWMRAATAMITESATTSQL